MKEEERFRKIRDFLLEHKEATWTEIQKHTNIQSKEISNDLKNLINKGEIICEKRMKDRRKTWYMLKDERKTHTEKKRYESIKFIEDLNDPIYNEKSFPKKDYEISVSWFLEGKDKENLEKIIKAPSSVMDETAHYFQFLADVYTKLGVEKTVLVLTAKKK
jgi:DNA-binding MarR family transcriptional regulator